MRWLVIVCFLANALLAFGQNHLVGTVQDSSSQERLPNVIIQIQEELDGGIIDFTITDEAGHFEINTSLDSGIISANLLGYVLKSFRFNKDTNSFEFDLFYKENSLEEITVKAYKSGIIRNGDTITYKTEVFTNGTEEDLKDILKRLPGIDVEENGNITANGKPVDKLKLEGDEFMNNNRNTALLGIGGDNVEIVDLYTSSELVTGNELTVLDIKLKSDFKRRWNGELHIGGGINRKYLINGTAYRLGHRTKLFFNTKANNIENHPVTIADYHRLNGGRLNYLRSVTNQRTEIPRFFLNRVNNREQQFFLPSLNFSHKITSSSTISGHLLGFSGVAHRENITESIQNQTFQLTNENIERIKISNFFSHLKYEHEIDEKSSLEAIASLNINFENNQIANQSTFQQEEIEQNIDKQADNQQGLGNITYHRILGKHLFFHANAGYLISSDDLNSKLESNQTIPWTYSLIGTDEQIVVYQNHITNQTTYVETGIRGNWEYLEYNANLEIGSNILSGRTELENATRLERHSNEIAFTNTIKLEKGLWRFNAGITIQNFNIEAITNVKRQYAVLPSLSIGYKFRTGFRNINLSYRGHRNLATLSTAVSVPYFENSTILNRSEINVDDFEKRQGWSLFYGDFNLLNNQSIWIILNYSKGYDIEGTNTLFFDNYQIVEQLLNKRTVFLGAGNYEKKISQWKSSISTKVSYQLTQTPLFLQSLELNQSISNTSIDFFYNSIFKKGFNFELACQLNHLDLKFANNKQTNFTLDSSAKLTYQKGSYRIQTEYNFFNRVVNNESIPTHYINASATKNVHKNWAIFVEAYHILQLNQDIQQSIRRNEFNVYEKNTYFRFPGYIVGGIKLSL